MMSSTGEVKDAVRLAQQYNIHIYKYLINGLGNSSQRISQLKVELDVYSRSSMKFFDRLYQIRDSKIPCMRVREEQINAFREQVKRNDKLIQEVHNIQRGLWNLRAMGQRVPMANKNLILQAFPELCVSTRPDNVPLTVLCEQIIHKYSLRNERSIMDMLRWADEERLARKMSNQIDQIKPGLPVVKSVAIENKPATDNFEMNNDVTPVQSWDDISDEVIQPGEMEEHSTTTSGNGMKSNTSTDKCTSQDTPLPVIISPNEMDCSFLEVDNHANSTKVMSNPVDKTPSNHETDEVSKQKNSMISELMTALRNIPELDSLLDKPVVSNNQSSPVNKSNQDPCKGHLQKPNTLNQTMTNTSTIKKDSTLTKIEDCPLDYKKNIHHEYNHRSRQALSWDEIMKRFTKPAKPQSMSAAVSQPEPVAKSSLPAEKSCENSESKVLSASTESSSTSDIKDPLPNKVSIQKSVISNVTSNTQHCEAKQNQAPDSFAERSITSIKNEVLKTPVKVKPLQPLVGTDRPHVYENIIKKRKQHGPSNKVNTMTSAEVDEYKKKREDALRELELKKQRTKNILNKEYDKTFPKKSAVHYFKVQNVPKVQKISMNTSTVGPSKYQAPPTSVLTNTRKVPVSTTHVSNLTSRKRPASSVNSVSYMPAPKRARRPRIILKIFREEDDWNVEQVIDRD